MHLPDSVARILDVMMRFHGQGAVADYTHIKNLVARFVQSREPVRFVLPAFPGKSINPDSVFSCDPDRGDYCAVQTLIRMNKEISCVYEPGGQIDLLHDGHFFQRTGCVRPVSEMDSYIEKIRTEASKRGIGSYTIESFFRELSQERMLDSFYAAYVPAAEQVSARVASSETARADFTHKTCFVYNEFAPVLWPGTSNNQKQKRARKLAVELMRIEIGVADLVADLFPHHVRLSIHRQTDPVSKKFFINLLPENTEGLATPWFHVPLQTSEGMVLVKRTDVSRADLVTDEIGGPYLQATNSKTIIKRRSVGAMYGNEYSYTEPQMADAIAQGLPAHIPFNRIAFNHRGWTSVIAEIGEGWIAKFPRSAAAFKHLSGEGLALDAIRPHIDFEIPRRFMAATEPPFFYHEKLRGQHFGPDEYVAANDRQKEAFCHSCASVMAQINAVPIVRMMGSVPMVEFDLPPDDGIFPFLSRRFMPHELVQAKKITDRYRTLEKPDNYVRVGPFDFHGYNIVVDPLSKKIRGVFDFDELGIGDLHFGLREIRLHYGDEVGERVCRNYETITDRKIDRAYLDLCFKGWYLFELARLLKNQGKMKGIADVCAERHVNRIRTILREDMPPRGVAHIKPPVLAP